VRHGGGSFDYTGYQRQAGSLQKADNDLEADQMTWSELQERRAQDSRRVVDFSRRAEDDWQPQHDFLGRSIPRARHGLR
jgi:hypothetical protein